MYYRWLALLLGFVVCPAWAVEVVLVTDPWIRAMPPRMPVTAAFMTVQNLTAQPLSLIAVESPAFGRIELHRTEIDAQGLARMVAQNQFVLPPHGSLSLAPKGNHLMLYQPQQPLQPGTQLPLTLIFAEGQRVVVQAEVKAGLGDDAMDHHHHH